MSDDAEPYGYDPEKRRRRAMRDLFDRMEQETQTQSLGLQQIGTAAGLPQLTAVKRRRIEAAVKVRTEPPHQQPVTYQHSMLCQTALPLRAQEARVWDQRQGNIAIRIVAGEAYHPKLKTYVDLALPYGSRARLVMFHINNQAVKTGSPVVEVEDSMTAFVRRLMGGVDPSGPQIRSFKDQLGALSACTMRFAYDGADPTQFNTQIIDKFDLWFPKDHRQRVLWPTYVEIAPRYFESLLAHAVPLNETTIAALSNNATALDVYCWLAHRLHRVPYGRSQLVPWSALYQQFGQGYSRIRKFREKFTEILKLVTSYYTDARLKVDAKGLHLLNSPPPVPKSLIAVSRGLTLDHQPD